MDVVAGSWRRSLTASVDVDKVLASPPLNVHGCSPSFTNDISYPIARPPLILSLLRDHDTTNKLKSTAVQVSSRDRLHPGAGKQGFSFSIYTLSTSPLPHPKQTRSASSKKTRPKQTSSLPHPKTNTPSALATIQLHVAQLCIPSGDLC